VSFSSHVALLHHFLTNRRAIVERIERSLLNVRDKDVSRSRNRTQFARLLDSCFWDLPNLPRDVAHLKGDLAARHRDDGFEPVQLDAFVNELDPLELIVRAYAHWAATRWPGSAGRLAYAQTLFAVAVIRQLEYLSLRIWDDGRELAQGRLAEVQGLLDVLNTSGPACVFVRDAAWLIQTGLGPFTKHLRAYFAIADHIAASFTDQTRSRLHRAGALLAGGHLRSQLHYRMWQTHLPIDDPENLAYTRNSNALDNALLVRDLVPLLRAYRAAGGQHDEAGRRVLADAILQGLSVDPDLFVSRLDLLAAYTIVEDIFVERPDRGRARYSRFGETHMAQLAEFRELLGQTAAALRTDADALAPGRVGYSPLGITYGFCADLMANIAADTLVGQPSFGLSLEDVFISGGQVTDKLTRSRGWQRLPRRAGENEHFDYSTEIADQTLTWLLTALEARATRPHEANASPRLSSRVFVTSASAVDHSTTRTVPERVTAADDYRLESDPARASQTDATAWPTTQLLTDRVEGRLLASAEVDGAWTGISKILLTRLTGQATDASITHVPRDVIDVLELTCPGLVVDVSPRVP
jgi:hypothetical protein